MTHPYDEFEDDDDFISKSERKRQMNALQQMGNALVDLNAEQLAGIPMTPELEKAVLEAKRIKSNEGLRRQKQYIGKLMRKADHEAIEEALNAIDEQQNRMARAFHQMEQWRDELIAGEEDVLTRFISTFTEVDRQQLRTLIRNAKTEKARNKPPTSARKLFKLIREQFAAQK